MKKNRLRIINLFLIFMLFNILCGIQSTVWPQIFKSLPSPLLWLIIIVYISLYRTSTYYIFFIYTLGITLSVYTVIPLKIIFATFLTIYFFNYFIHKKIFSDSPSYFLLMVALSSPVFHIMYFMFSMLIDDVAPPIQILHRIISILITISTSIPIYLLLKQIDRITQIDKEVPSEQM